MEPEADAGPPDVGRYEGRLWGSMLFWVHGGQANQMAHDSTVAEGPGAKVPRATFAPTTREAKRQALFWDGTIGWRTSMAAVYPE